MRHLRLRLVLVFTLLSSGTALAHPGIGIVRDAQGNIYYTDLAQVWKIDVHGRKSVAVRQVHTHELALDAGGNLFGEHLWYEGEKTDRWGHRVWRRSPDGKVTDVVPPRQGFLRDYGFVRDSSGSMYWVERGERTVFRKTTAAGHSLDLAICSDCHDVRWLALGGDGRLLFSDAGDLRELGTGGSFRTLARGLQSRRDGRLLMGIWTDGRRGIYVADYGHRAVKRIGPNGQVTLVATSPFPWGPSGGLLAPDGTLWLLESSVTNQVRVRRIQSGGRERIF